MTKVTKNLIKRYKKEYKAGNIKQAELTASKLLIYRIETTLVDNVVFFSNWNSGLTLYSFKI